MSDAPTKSLRFRFPAARRLKSSRDFARVRTEGRMGTPAQYPWTLNLIWKLLQNDPGAVGLFRSNPFPDKPPLYVRAVLYRYSLVRPNPQGLWWKRERLGLWLPPLSADNRDLRQLLREAGWR